MARTENLAAARLAEVLRAEDGIASACAQLLEGEDTDVAALSGDEIVEQHVPADLAEKGACVRYPAIYVYCERLANKLREKFRTFSGTATLAIDIRASHEHLDQLQEQLQLYVGSVTDVLHRKRGAWSEGLFYTGGYEIVYSPIKKGGRNYLQSALLRLEVQISVN